MVGSGGLVAMNQQTCMVSIARFFMEFTQSESCGKCVLCREGTRQMLALLDDIIEGRADAANAGAAREARRARCRKARSAAWARPRPTRCSRRCAISAPSTTRTCSTSAARPASARPWPSPSIDAAICKGCTACAQKCPVGAISGEKKTAPRHRPGKCIKCGACADACKFDAVVGV